MPHPEPDGIAAAEAGEAIATELTRERCVSARVRPDLHRSRPAACRHRCSLGVRSGLAGYEDVNDAERLACTASAGVRAQWEQMWRG